MPKVHPTAIVHKDARIADDVEIGPCCIVDRDVEIGAGCILRDHAVVRRYTSLGEGNFLDSFVVLGGEPQDLKFDPDTATHLRIGSHNVFREHVTINRATAQGGATLVGNRTYWMVGSHAGHDATIEDEVVLVNNAAVAGHATIHRGTILSANVLIHQFCWVGEMVMTEGAAGTRSHVPPYTMLLPRSQVCGLNVIGLRRAEAFTADDRRQIKEAYHITYREGLNAADALAKMDACEGWGEPASRFREFVRKVVQAESPFDRGLCRTRPRAGRA